MVITSALVNGSSVIKSLKYLALKFNLSTACNRKEKY